MRMQTNTITAVLALAGASVACADITGTGAVIDLAVEGFSSNGRGDAINVIGDGETRKGFGPGNTLPAIIGTTTLGREVIGEWYEQDRTDGREGSLVVIRISTVDESPLVPLGTQVAGAAATHFSIRVGSAQDGGLPFASWVDHAKLTGFSLAATNQSQTMLRRASDDPLDQLQGRANATIDTIEEWDGVVEGGFWSGVFGDPFFVGTAGELGDWHTMQMVIEIEAIPAPMTAAVLGLGGLAAARRRR